VLGTAEMPPAVSGATGSVWEHLLKRGAANAANADHFLRTARQTKDEHLLAGHRADVVVHAQQGDTGRGLDRERELVAWRLHDLRSQALEQIADLAGLEPREKVRLGHRQHVVEPHEHHVGAEVRVDGTVFGPRPMHDCMQCAMASAAASISPWVFIRPTASPFFV